MSGKSETSPPSGVTDENQPTGQESTASSPTSSVSPEAPNPERTPRENANAVRKHAPCCRDFDPMDQAGATSLSASMLPFSKVQDVDE
ncbi:hypothetical protein EYB26_002615 [Talaromyces marneffei]|uniref:uncharacterized protein n=1 Tax=Talaromyces marneffei TaxID=37727 RepID=UPI0012A78C79|nr:uncharacterized protein EYB26_002615 [Talaromyces marneffei]QGA14959.1 hypothetical protein EYB26_002615 [Talaromyces marneffei]